MNKTMRMLKFLKKTYNKVVEYFETKKLIKELKQEDPFIYK
jgi:hypothetical protein